MKISSSTLLIVLATLLWGGSAPIMKLTLREFPIFTLAFLRMIVAAIILGAFFYKNLKIQRSDIPTFIAAGLTGITLNISLFFFGLKYAPAINAALLIAAVPILTLIIAHFILKEKLSRRLVLGSITAIIGIVIIVGFPSTSTKNTEMIGNILLLLSALSWVFYEIFTKKLSKKYNGTTIAVYSMAIGAITFLPFSIFEFLQTPSWTQNVTTSGFLGLLYGIFGASLIAYWAWQQGLAKLGATEASFFFYLDPISGAILSILLLGESVTPQLLLGGILISIAVILAETHRKHHPLYKTKE